MRSKFAIGLLAGALLTPSTASALNDSATTIYLTQYEKGNDEVRHDIEWTFLDIEDGLGWANQALVATRFQKPLYCRSKYDVIIGPEMVRMMQRYVANHPDAAMQPVGLSVRLMMQEAFPCSP